MTDKEKIRAEIIRRIEEEQRIRREKEKLTGVGSITDTRYESLLSFIDSMQEEPTIPDIVDEHYWEMLGEEPVSEDMWEASKQYALRQVLASTDAEMTEQAYLSLKLFSGFEIAVAHKDGANWQKEQDKQWLAEEHKHIFAKGRDSMKQQMMKNAIERNVQIDAGGYPYIDVNVELYDYDKDIPLAKEGDKVMVVVIKEE